MKKDASYRPQAERIHADPDAGLSAEQVEERKKKGYVNVASDPNDKSVAKIIAGNLFTFFNIVLLAIALAFTAFMIYLNSIGRSDIIDEYFGFSKFVFLIPAALNVVIGSFQEIQSLQVIKKLRIVTGTKNKVLRGGTVRETEATEIVLDDIVVLSAGDQATADLEVLVGEVEVDESMLTGESDHVRKTAGDTVLSGSSVIVGNARCRAEKIGDDTYAAELTRKVKSGSRHKSELMSSIMRFIKVLTVCMGVAVIVTTVTLAVKISMNGDASIWGLELSLKDPVAWALIVLTDGMFSIGIIPYGLVLTTSVAMMVSIAQLTKKQTLVQELYSLENLSRVNVICLDKTGTLTDGSMTVSDVKAFASMQEVERHMRALMRSAEDRNATSEAIFQYFGMDEDAQYREVIPFSSANKYSGIVYNDGKKLLMGAPEYLLEENDERLSYVTERAGEGNRVIAVTYDGELIAFIAIEDRIRDSAADTLRFFRENGVDVKVISGDNPLTVSMIAQKCGIENADKYISLAGVAPEEIPAIAEKYTVFARVSPEQKEALVTALQAQGNKVAMTGDGVNDILALRRADSSVTFAKATEAAKSCSDVVLLDNDFSHLKEVVGEGRRVIGNTQKTAVLYLMKSVVAFVLSFALIPFARAQMWFSIENLYMLEAAVICTGGFLLSLEPRRTPVRGSFLKNIVSKSIGAGLLATAAVLLPILCNTVPKAFGVAPFVADENVRAMMTILMTITGIVVLFSMCIPFNRYRAFALAAVTVVAVFLGFALPSAYIGGHTIGADMLAFDKAAGQTFFDAPLFREMFRPLNCEAVRSLLGDVNNFIVIRIFLYAAIPAFILTYFAVENFARKDYKDVTKHRAFRVGRRLMLSTGFVLILHALLAANEMITGSSYILSPTGINKTLTLVINVIFVLMHVAIGVLGYKVWKDPTKKMIKAGFAAALALLALTVIPMIVTGSVIAGSGILLRIDSAVVLIDSLLFVAGAIIVTANYDLGLPKPRDK